MGYRSNMKIKINNKIYTNEGHIDDIKKLRMLMEELGFLGLTTDELSAMWYEISDDYCAGWLTVPNTTEELLDYLEIIEV